jgi:hypothetical protein
MSDLDFDETLADEPFCPTLLLDFPRKSSFGEANLDLSNDSSDDAKMMRHTCLGPGMKRSERRCYYQVIQLFFNREFDGGGHFRDEALRMSLAALKEIRLTGIMANTVGSKDVASKCII